MSTDTDKRYRINDVLTSLANELGVEFASEDHEDDVLNNLTHIVADAFGIKEDEDR